jgi:type IV pilus assembly PilX-like protein
MMMGKNTERGIALFMSLIILLLLSALAITLVFMSNTDTAVNTNYKNGQVLYFGAKGGLEEARARLPQSAGVNSIIAPACTGGAGACLPAIPALPGSTPGIPQIIYLRGGANPGAVQPWLGGSIYTDDELCHEGYPVGAPAKSGDVHCDAPGAGAWYAVSNSVLPFAGTNAAMPYNWVRVGPKLNASVDGGYGVGGAGTGVYSVNKAKAANALVCWDGSNEFVLDVAAMGNDCTKVPNRPANPVYMITALSANAQTSSRRLVQTEVALAPTPPFPYGMFATGTGCSALQLGGGATTDSYTSAGGGNYNSTKSNTGGDVGSNGNVYMNGSSTQVGGAIGVPAATTGPCPGSGLTISGGAGFLPPTSQNKLLAAGPYVFPTPPSPSPAPPTTDYKITKDTPLPPGSYGNIQATAGATITLSPGTYNVNSLSLAGNAVVTVNPPGAVIFNVAGVGQATVFDTEGGTLTNTTGVANNFLINYAGTGQVKLSGGTSTYVTVNAPNAAVEIKGGSDIYGAVIGATVTNLGGVAFHYDKNTSLAPQSNAYYSQIALRDIQY